MQAAKAERAILAQASAQARLQATTGDLAAAEQTLAAALGKVDQNSVAALRTQNQLAQVQNKAASEATKASSAARQMGASFKSGLLDIVGPAAVATAGLAAVVKVAGSFQDAFKFKADLDATTASINAQLKGVRDTAQVYAQADAFADKFKLTQQETTGAIQASIGVMRNSKASVEDIISVLARMQILSPEQSLQEAAVALKGLAGGDTQSLVTRFEVSRDRANEMKAEIAGGADAVQVLSQFLNDSGIGMDALAAKTVGAAGAMKDAAIAGEELALAQARFAEGPGLAILNTQIETTRGLTRVLSGDFDAMGQSMANSAEEGTVGMRLIHAITGENIDLTANLAAAAQAAGQAQADASAQALSGAEGLRQALAESVAAREQAAAAIAAHTVMVTGDNDALIQSAEVTRESALQSMIDAESKATQAERVRALQEQASAAVTEFLRLNPQIDAAGIAAAVAAGRIDPMIGQLAILRQEAANTANSIAQMNSVLAGGIGGLTPNRGLVERGPVGGALGQGAGSSEAGQRFRTRAAINALYPTAVAAPRVRGGGGGGGGAASIGGKLEDTRIKEMQQSEDAELAHRKRLLDIEKDYAEQSAAIGRENEVSKRQSRASFYDDLSKATKDIGGEAAQSLSAEYEAAFAKSQEFAAKGQNQLAKEYLKTRQEQLRDEVDYQQELAQARADGNTDEVQRLEQIHQLQQDAQRAELALVEQGGDSVQNARQEALAQEALKYEESLGKIANTADRKEAQIVGSFENQASAADAWADAMVSAAGRVDTALDKIKPPAAPGGAAGEDAGGDGVAAAGGGGQGLTSAGRATLGGSRAAGGGGDAAVATLSEAHVILDMILALGNVAKKYIKPIELYKQTLGTAIELLTAAADFHTAAQSAATSPISPALIQQLVDEARWVLDLTRAALVPTNERQVEIFERYASTVQSSIGVLSDMADLRQTLSDALRNSSPFDVTAVVWLARRAQEFTALVLAQLIPLTEKQAEGMDRYAAGVGAAVDIIGGLAGLRQTVTEAMKDSAPFDSTQIGFLVGRAKEFTGLVQNQLVPTTEATAAGFDAYATSVGASVEIIGGIATLRQTVSEAMANSQPFDSKQIAFLVGRAKEFTALVREQLVPTTEQQSEEIARYAEAVTASAAALRAPLELSGNLFADYVSPSDAQLDMVAEDARRFVDRLAAAAATYSTEGLAASKAYAEGIGATFSAAKEGLLFFDALASGDYRPQPAALAEFEAGTMDLLDVIERLGGRAVAIPAGNIAALQSAAGALSATAESLINIAAVPYGNLGGIASGLGGGSSTTTTTNYFSNTFVLPAGSTQQMANEVMGIVRRQMENRR